jgi:endoglucanase
VLFDTLANPVARTAIGVPGEFHAGYAGFITSVLDAHAAVGATCILDLHNYARYRDFRWQADGSVLGLMVPADRLLRPYTSDRSQVIERIFALAPGASLSLAHFTDFWARAARQWGRHPGLGGYGLMNEPHDLPAPGGVLPTQGRGEDLTIWPRFAQAAIRTIRGIDTRTPIYVSGNTWNSAMSLATRNPGFPLQGENLIYEVHLYLDAFSNGNAFDYEAELAKNFSAGFGVGPIHAETGADRLRMATRWAAAQGVRLALTEVGMPLDDVRWQRMFERTLAHAQGNAVEVYSWMGGGHWPIRSYPINHVPGWSQNKTLEPLVAGPMKAAMGVSRASLFDAGPGHAPGGATVTVTVFARGYLAQPLRLSVASNHGGSLSKTELLIPAGANGQDSYSFTPAANRVSVLSYSAAPGVAVPPARKVYSLSEPEALAPNQLPDAAAAVLARYRACKWEMADGFTDFLMGRPAQDGQAVRAVADSGFGSDANNAMDMLNWVNRDTPASGAMRLPAMRSLAGRRATEHGPGIWGLWCKKSLPQPGVMPRPSQRVPYALEDPHFVVVALSVPQPLAEGVVFQASQSEGRHASEIRLVRGHPQLRFADARGQVLQLASPLRLVPRIPVVLTLLSSPGQQRLRLNTEGVASAAASFAPSAFSQLLIGWGFLDHAPLDGFQGHVFAVIAGRGAPSASELELLERYLARTAGLDLP